MYLKRLEEERIDRDKTQRQISEYLGCQREVYRRYEKGIRDIPVDYLVKLANYYNTTTDYLCELTDEKKVPRKRRKK